ncbi:MAG: VCBS repeat-containing protein [Planctomycetaceae bacterium]
MLWTRKRLGSFESRPALVETLETRELLSGTTSGTEDAIFLQNQAGYWQYGTINFNGGARSYEKTDGPRFSTILDPFLGDFNGDGQSDMAGFDRGSGNWWVAVSQVDGSYQTTRWGRWLGNDKGDPSAASVNWEHIQIGDFNNDGRDDIAGLNEFGRWWIAFSNGSRFNSTTTIRTNSGIWTEVFSGDVDGDGDDDLTLRSDQGLWFFLKSTGSGFGVQYAGRWATTGWAGIAQGDFNGDGLQDVIGITEAGHWWVGQSNGMQFTNLYRGHWEGSAGATLYVGDFNGDGTDQPLLNSPAHVDSWRTGAAHAVSGRFYVEAGSAGAFDVGTNWEFTIGDFDGSGTDDVVGYLYGHDIRFLDGMYFMSINGRNMSDSLEFADTYSTLRLFGTGCLPVA